MMTRLLGLAIACLLSASTSGGQSIELLQKSLNSAIQDDEPITLTRGDDFISAPGTVILLSRQEGRDRLLKMSRDGEPEFCIIFLPRWQVWITETVIREYDEAKLDSRYMVASLESEPIVERWHTHNNVGQPLNPEDEARRSVQWTMPSPADLLQLYSIGRDLPTAKFRGVIASIYGVTTYWNDDPKWTQPKFVSYAVLKEADMLNNETSNLSVDELPEFAESHKGFVKLRFEPVP